MVILIFTENHPLIESKFHQIFSFFLLFFILDTRKNLDYYADKVIHPINHRYFFSKIQGFSDL